MTPIDRSGGRVAGYSKRVRRIKLALPVIAAASLALIFLAPREDFTEGLGLSPEDRATLGDGLRLFSPRFAGTTVDGEPYALRADWALPDGPNPKKIDMGDLEGEITLKDGRSLTLTAPDGRFWPRQHRLRLRGGVEIDSSDGYSVRTKVAWMNGEEKTVTTKTPIEAWGPEGRLEAGSMHAQRDENGDDVVKFDGGVRVVFRPDAKTDSEPDGETGDDVTGEGKRQQ